jgi:phosphatidate phosphatase APP1
MPENSAPSPLLLLSDLDDTIKISNTQSKFITIYRGLFRSSAFAGMSELYTEILSRHKESSFYIVSSSPPAIRGKIDFFLSKNRFPKAEILLRDWIRQPSVLKYKLKSILDLVEASKYPVLLVGDDTEHDPEVFSHMEKKCPEKVLARYIRVVRGRELPEGTHGFFTAFDLACAELAAGRLSSEQVLRVGEAVLKAEKNSRLIPRFSLKPPLHFVPFLANADLLEIWKKIQSKIEAMPKRKTKT